MGFVNWLKRRFGRSELPAGRHERVIVIDKVPYRDKYGRPVYVVYEVDSLGKEKLVGMRTGSRF